MPPLWELTYYAAVKIASGIGGKLWILPGTPALRQFPGRNSLFVISSQIRQKTS
ncbi:MAG: hypothetical protein J5858_07975 [Lentisphaeria bacterium]|nr:hypothetical protein [Lentisphaeria bacterium]